jgi:hypothetical protein
MVLQQHQELCGNDREFSSQRMGVHACSPRPSSSLSCKKRFFLPDRLEYSDANHSPGQKKIAKASLEDIRKTRK